MTSAILESLNPIQRRAVTTEHRSSLVLAGAGSGKTRVLVHRLAWLLETGQVEVPSILSVTFTNRAAREMRLRMESLISFPLASSWMGTFHGLAHRILRLHASAAGLSSDFQIIDSDEQRQVIRGLMKKQGHKLEKEDLKKTQVFINRCKERGERARVVSSREDSRHRQDLQLYALYEEYCQKEHIVDFSELLLRVHELWREHREILDHYREKFREIVVDEFQDTNVLQYDWLKQLITPRTRVMVVGDDDQSIYRFRGAGVYHLKRFREDYPDTEVIRLEQNYRSPGAILRAANQLIAQNSDRMGKTLWTERDIGEPISVFNAYNEYAEAEYVAREVQNWLKGGHPASGCAILYRSNAQSRVFEETLLKQKVPYHIHSGVKFFQRTEVKDALAYLRLFSHHEDDGAFERVINMPGRGVGPGTLQKLRQAAESHGVSLWDLAKQDKQYAGLQGLSPRIQGILRGFVEWMESVPLLPLDQLVKALLEGSGLFAHYTAEAGATQEGTRAENLYELVNAAENFQRNIGAVIPAEAEGMKRGMPVPPVPFALRPEGPSRRAQNLLWEEGEPSSSEIPQNENGRLEAIHAFLAHAMLNSLDSEEGEVLDGVHLMTLHAVKGLEFPVVFITGMEEDLFPSRMADTPEQLEEERRLCYVGVTRTIHKLHLTHVTVRKQCGMDSYRKPSRFLGEIPDGVKQIVETVKRVRPANILGARVFEPASSNVFPAPVRSSSQGALGGYCQGMAVVHPVFGEGVIRDLRPTGDKLRVTVYFRSVGEKVFDPALAKLVPKS